MKRRTFLKSCTAALAAMILPRQQHARATGMKHLYWNDEGETVAANSVEQAARYHDAELSGYTITKEEFRDGEFFVHVEGGLSPNGWSRIPDNNPFPIANQDDGGTLTKLASEWAAECDEPTQVATTYW
jgi:hypothetical protein